MFVAAFDHFVRLGIPAQGRFRPNMTDFPAGRNQRSPYRNNVVPQRTGVTHIPNRDG